MLSLLRPSLKRLIRVSDPGPLLETERDFLPPSVFYKQLTDRGFDFFTGVPDSLLKDICAYISDNHPAERHLIAANEGAAVAIGTGYHMATHKFPVVYLQNSGLGNIINPLLSLVNARVFRIPILLLIGWRGEPGKKDEPQHIVQGKIMSSMMTELGISYEVLPDYEEGAASALDAAQYHLAKRGSPYAFLVRRQCFLEYKIKNSVNYDRPLNREEAIFHLIGKLSPYDAVVSTTGFPSRELYEARKTLGIKLQSDFYCVGSMGHASSIALGIALAKPSRTVYCLDGDGALIMHMGAVTQIGARNIENLRHIVLNNGAHDSVGGQPTMGIDIDCAGIARSCGYKYVRTVTSREEIDEAFEEMANVKGTIFLEIQVKRQTRKDLGRPKEKPAVNKELFMKFLDF